MDFPKRWVGAAFLLLLFGMLVMHFIDRGIEMKASDISGVVHSGPWGELEERDIRLEQPMEYAGFESVTGSGVSWNFGAMSPASVKELLMKCGCLEEQANGFLATRKDETGFSLVLNPDEEQLLSLNPQTRSALYLALARIPANRFQAAPYFIANGDIEILFDKQFSSNAKAISLMKELVYIRNGFTYFSDPEVVLSHLPSMNERREFLQSLTSENAVLMRLLIRPNSDIDKPLAYWGLTMPRVLHKDLAPLFEAQRRLPSGGDISLLYLLPPLAREHLFTSPLPPEEGEGKLPDCHWTALNFFSDQPDSRMSDSNFASRYIIDHYYEVARPGIAGDLVLLLNQENLVVHSAVYLADDVVFTKNGINYANPWLIMHEHDMVGEFSALEPMKVAYFRLRNR